MKKQTLSRLSPFASLVLVLACSDHGGNGGGNNPGNKGGMSLFSTFKNSVDEKGFHNRAQDISKLTGQVAQSFGVRNNTFAATNMGNGTRMIRESVMSFAGRNPSDYDADDQDLSNPFSMQGEGAGYYFGAMSTIGQLGSMASTGSCEDFATAVSSVYGQSVKQLQATVKQLESYSAKGASLPSNVHRVTDASRYAIAFEGDMMPQQQGSSSGATSPNGHFEGKWTVGGGANQDEVAVGASAFMKGAGTSPQTGQNASIDFNFASDALANTTALSLQTHHAVDMDIKGTVPCSSNRNDLKPFSMKLNLKAESALQAAKGDKLAQISESFDVGMSGDLACDTMDGEGSSTRRVASTNDTAMQNLQGSVSMSLKQISVDQIELSMSTKGHQGNEKEDAHTFKVTMKKQSDGQCLVSQVVQDGKSIDRNGDSGNSDDDTRQPTPNRPVDNPTVKPAPSTLEDWCAATYSLSGFGRYDVTSAQLSSGREIFYRLASEANNSPSCDVVIAKAKTLDTLDLRYDSQVTDLSIVKLLPNIKKLLLADSGIPEGQCSVAPATQCIWDEGNGDVDAPAPVDGNAPALPPPAQPLPTTPGAPGLPGHAG